tara:strand:+ start:125 stop:433 length:309 start_codon:yes stop_codon:yes gene_type:complete
LLNGLISGPINVLRNEWDEIAQIDVTQDEVDRVITYLTTAYPLRFDGIAPIANLFGRYANSGARIVCVVTCKDRLKAVSLERINKFAFRFLEPDQLRIFVVG